MRHLCYWRLDDRQIHHILDYRLISLRHPDDRQHDILGRDRLIHRRLDDPAGVIASPSGTSIKS